MGDAAGIAAVHIASSDEAYAPLAAEWSRANIEARTARWATILAKEGPELVMVAEDGTGGIIGFVGGGPARHPEPAAEVEIYFQGKPQGTARLVDPVINAQLPSAKRPAKAEPEPTGINFVELLQHKKDQKE